MRSPLFKVFMVSATLLLVAMINAATAAPTGSITLTNSSRLILGSEFLVEINVAGLTNGYGFDLCVSFDAEMLEVVDQDADTSGFQIQCGDLFEKGARFQLQHQVQQDLGRIDFAMALLRPELPVSGKGSLVKIRFRSKHIGMTVVTLEKLSFGTPSGELLECNGNHGDMPIVNLTITESILAIQPFEAGSEFRFSILGVVGKTYVIQVSSDLVRWYEVDRFVFNGSAVTVTTTLSNSVTNQFFRVFPVSTD